MGGKKMDEEFLERAKEDVLNKWKSMGYDIEYVRNLDVEEYINRFFNDEQKKALIKQILNEGIKKDIIIAITGTRVKFINGIEIDLNKSIYELSLLYKKVCEATIKKLFFTKKNLFFYWQ
jgi:hypothetical protein